MLNKLLSYLSYHLNISRSIVPQMFMTNSIDKFKPKFNQLSVNLLKCSCSDGRPQGGKSK